MGRLMIRVPVAFAQFANQFCLIGVNMIGLGEDPASRIPVSYPTIAVGGEGIRGDANRAILGVGMVLALHRRAFNAPGDYAGTEQASWRQPRFSQPGSAGTIVSADCGFFMKVLLWYRVEPR